jgi:MoaA/NifB/PqqE/SkfB family radical SAM enzyme
MLRKRVDIKTGMLCNNNCRFCAQAHKRRFGNRTTQAIQADLAAARRNGCEGVVFTGGESSIRDDIIELVSAAKKEGFTTIQLQTNARMLAYPQFCRQLIDAGVNEFAPALHGHTPALHDYLTRAPGSFQQTVQAIRNLHTQRQHIITNTVVVKPNMKHLPAIADLLISLRVDQFQFAFVHAVGNASENYDELMPRVSEAVPFIKRGLQKGIDHGLKVMAEAMPLCTMSGYEQYCSEFFIPQTEIRDVASYDPSYDKTRKTEGKVKFPSCRTCVHDTSCEGPWKEYPERMGSDEFRPVTHDAGRHEPAPLMIRP